MSFKVKDLAMSVGAIGAADDPCTTQTRPTTTGGCMAASAWFPEAARGSNLVALRAQLRKAVARS